MVVSKYGEEHLGWEPREPRGAMGCGVWKGICKGMDSFFRLVIFKVNNGERVRF